MSGPSLVVLAAGMGSRYGGIKQIDGIGADGESLLDYAVHDALRSGFAEVVFVIRKAIEEEFRAAVLARMGTAVPWKLAFQEADSLIPPAALEAARAAGRSKPWGTAHALLCARPALRGPFATINADDFYGRAAFEAMASFLSAPRVSGGPAAALVPYRLDRTLSPSGSVARGICRVRGGLLRCVEEYVGIERRGGKLVGERLGGERVELAADAPASMNFWGFMPEVLDGIERYFARFLAESAGNPKAEAYLPNAVGALVEEGALSVRALEADAEWFGMTYREDRAEAASRIRALAASGVYPRRLWPPVS